MPGLVSEMMDQRKDWVAKRSKRQTLKRVMTEVVSGILLVIAVYVMFNYNSVITNLSELLTPDNANPSSVHHVAKTPKPDK